MLEPSDFEIPRKHPFGMLANRGLSNTAECESFLAWMLLQCIHQESWDAIATSHNHPSLVDAGLLEKIADRRYKLTKKAIGLLYSEYAKE